ncbi:MAG: SRPBCC family protein [Jatrophihabitantaceae bacterium]
MAELTHSASIVVDRTPEQVYDLVSDVTRTGEWSPICRSCRWEDGDGPRVGARFTGRNEVPGRTWETHSQVIAAERGREFAWLVGDAYVRWGYTLAAVDGGTELTESWEFRPKGIAMFHEKYGDAAPEQIDERTRAAYDGIPRTLAAIKRIAESS